MGKTVKEAKGEVAYGAEFFRWFSEEAVRIHGRWMQAPGRRQPAADDQEAGRPVPVHHARGTSRSRWAPARSGPPIAAGCTMVVKPAAQTPLTMLALAAMLAEAGLPGRRAQRRHHQPRRGAQRGRCRPTTGCAR